jgi:hypothetical protein
MNRSEIINRLIKKVNGKRYLEIGIFGSNLYMYVIDTDYGCGIIKQGTQELLINNQKLNYANFEQNKQNWLNLISINNFIALEGV